MVRLIFSDRFTCPAPALEVVELVSTALAGSNPLGKIFLSEDSRPKKCGTPAFRPDVRELEITPDGKRMLVWRGGVNTELLLLETQAKLPPDTTRASVHWAELSLTVEPLAEWRQIFDDAWRLQRDFFYDPGLHGVDWAAVRRRYEPLVSRLTDRAELNELPLTAQVWQE